MKFFVSAFCLFLSWTLTPSAHATVDFTSYIMRSDFKLRSVPGAARISHWGESYLVESSNHQLSSLELTSSDRMYTEVAFSILAEAIRLPHNSRFPVFAKANENALGANSLATENTPAILQPASRSVNTDLKKIDGKNLSEILVNTALLYLFGAKKWEGGLQSPQSPIRIVSGQKDSKSPNAIRMDHAVAIYVPSLIASQKINFFETLLSYNFQEQFFASNTQREVIHFLNEHITYLEAIPAETLKELLLPIETSLQISLAPGFLARRSELRSTFVRYFERLHFDSTIANQILTSTVIPSEPLIQLPNRTPMQSTKEIRKFPIRALWQIYFTPLSTDRKNLVHNYARLIGLKPEQLIAELKTLASLSGENFYHVTSHLSQHTILYEHQTQLNDHRYKTLVVNPMNDSEARTIQKITDRIGSYFLNLNVPHGHSLTLNQARMIVEKAKELRVSTIMTIELPGATPAVENYFRQQGFELVTIDHHSHGVHINRTHRLSSLEQFANYFGYKLQPKDYLTGVMDRSFIYGLIEIGLNQDEILAILRSINREDFESLSKSLDLFLNAKKIPYKLKDGKITYIYLIYNRQGRMVEVSQAAAMLEFPRIANVLTISYWKNRETISFSGEKELADLFRLEFVNWTRYPEQYAGGNMRNTGYWGINKIQTDGNQNSDILNKIFSMLKYRPVETVRYSEEYEDKINARKAEIYKNFQVLVPMTQCERFFN